MFRCFSWFLILGTYLRRMFVSSTKEFLDMAKKWMVKHIYVLIGLAVGIAILGFILGSSAGAVATTMRLVQTQGSVTLTDDEEKTLDITQGMRLFSGNSLETKTDSAAFISLDDEKSVKLDASSSCTLTENGEQLQVDLLAGDLFFEVTAPLAENELFEIRTSNAVTSIRGTSGYIQNIDEHTSRYTLLTGKVDITYTDNATGEEQLVSLTAGQSVLITTAQDDAPPIVEQASISPEDVPNFVLEHIQDNDALLSEITQQSGMDLAGEIAVLSERTDEDDKDDSDTPDDADDSDTSNDADDSDTSDDEDDSDVSSVATGGRAPTNTDDGDDEDDAPATPANTGDDGDDAPTGNEGGGEDVIVATTTPAPAATATATPAPAAPAPTTPAPTVVPVNDDDDDDGDDDGDDGGDDDDGDDGDG